MESQRVPGSARRAMILIVDDEPAIRTLFELVLERRGHAVAAVASIHEALKVCDTRRPDLVIVDMVMPQGSGLELIRALRGQDSSPRIIAISGGGTWDRFDVLQRAAAAGADVTLRKPLGSEVLVETVERLLGGSAAP